ncbi:hypothetical protein D8674_006478 [Pyrus ussuriensis x Pyrus communis]|uniref:Uncharacterized protein n=1 Tax=Pyrus ussuriensis x Pyrus communis TaxID=2448454 RepID=A0A5N5FYW2_9ROSA|nr:hypothetical protein D8674_006478 [Pyrus ussuriensis x Pyrus communis]
MDFIIHGLLQDQPLSSPTIALVKPQTPATTAGKQIMTEATPTPLMSSQQLDQQPQSAAPTKTSKRALFPDQANKFDRKNEHHNYCCRAFCMFLAFNIFS